MRLFPRHVLDPADRLEEILFGLIMALGFTGAVRLGGEAAESRALFIGILGCNIAWGIVDGVMYVLSGLFERGRKAHLARQALSAPTEEAALDIVARELGGRPIFEQATAEERGRIHHWVLDILRRTEPKAARIERFDLLGAGAVALLIILCTAPVVMPFLLIDRPETAVRVANAVGLVELFGLGAWWGRVVGLNPWGVAGGLTVVGLVLVLVTIALGG